jgi:hypothetical protein
VHVTCLERAFNLAPAPRISAFTLLARVGEMTTTTKSSVPSNCLGGVPVCAGIDEAGRGPVMGARGHADDYCGHAHTLATTPPPRYARAGAMLYGIAYWPIAENEAISAMKFDGKPHGRRACRWGCV